ncbi:MAG: acyl-ACP--UDP-N-acetylglucosamine O-acyltransferase [Mesorhizobium sp.]|nr:acyl-ACP--UDP-N-acetylglucosamine O-acyltransferase [Mesorhizobium sp.]
MKSVTIHPMAVVEDGAVLGAGVRIGPFCHVGPDVVLGDNVELVSHVVVTGATTLGAGCKVYPQAVLGTPPQNAKHKGGRTTLVVGRNCTIREGVTFHAGTDTSRGETTVGDNGNFLAFSHVAHDCIVGNNVTFANGALIGGHAEIGDFVILGGLAAVHQFARVGHHAFVGGISGVEGDVIPYGMAVGARARLRGLNLIGMKRSGVSRDEIKALRAAYRLIFDRSNPMAENIEEARVTFAGSAAVADVIDFITSRGHRHFCVPPLGRAGDDAADDDA